MIETQFEKIAEGLQANYIHEEFKFEGHGASTLPVSKHRLSYEYKGVEINLLYEFGNFNMAGISAYIKTDTSQEDLHVETISHLGRLFSFKKKLWNIKCKDKNLIMEIEKQFIESQLDRIVDQTQFEPVIIGRNVDSRYHLHTKFSLAFNNKEESVLPMINFYKGMIDFLANS